MSEKEDSRKRAFERWFDGSKVVDAAGKPLVVYHGTTADFSHFNVAKRGAFFASSPAAASAYAGNEAGSNVMPAYLSLKNPYTSHVGRKGPEISAVIATAKRTGHDGAIVTYDDFPGETAYVAFHPEQIKSATGNNGDFNPSNPDIRASMVAEQPPQSAIDPDDRKRAFERWFDGSQVVDEKGKPLVVYHGTTREFDTFDPSETFDGGLYFTSNAEHAEEYAAIKGGEATRVMPVYLNIKRPLEIDASADDLGDQFNADWQQRLQEEILSAQASRRFDGIVVRNMDALGYGRDSTIYIAFSPEQIKSAIGNNGDFNPSNPDIRASKLADDFPRVETDPDARKRAFERWFDGSKVVDAAGKPLVLYHGAKTDIEDGIFRMEKGMLGTGVYFTRDPKEADFFTSNAVWRTEPNIVPAYVSIKNPYYAKDKWDRGAIKASENGHDGTILLDADAEILWAIPFSSNQIKSAHGNNGDFDPSNPDIRASMVAERPPQSAIDPDARKRAFERWFARSQVVDEKGKPLVVYHGTVADFSEFGEGGNRRTKGGRDGAFYFTPSPEVADAYAGTATGLSRNDDDTYSPAKFGMTDGGNVIAAYLSLQNPLVYQADGRMYSAVEDAAFEQAKAGGHDGIIFRKIGDQPGAQGSLRAYLEDAYVAFRPEQIKSALGNIGDFDPVNPDIRASMVEEEPPQSAIDPDARKRAFERWFARSQVVDEKGKPLVMYHGTAADFAIFSESEVGANMSADSRGFFFTGQPEIASYFAAPDDCGYSQDDQLDGANVMPVFLKIEKPLTLNPILKILRISRRELAEMLESEELRDLGELYDMGRDSILKEVDSKGYDGVFLEYQGQRSAVVFRPEQIKSALGNIGDFDPANPDILASMVVEDSPQAVNPRWFETALKAADSASPLTLYHGTRSRSDFDRFIPGGPEGAEQRGDAFGVGAYLTSSPSEANFFAGSDGVVIPVYVNGRVLDVDAPLSAELQAQMTALAQQHLLPSDKARFDVGRKRQSFDNIADARDFFESQRKNWEAFGEKMERCRPEVVSNANGQFVIEYADFDAAVEIQTPQDLWTLLRTVGFEAVREFGYDGIMMTRGEDDEQHRWVIMYNTQGTIKSALGNNGDFNPYDPRICHSLVQPGEGESEEGDESESQTEMERMRP